MSNFVGRRDGIGENWYRVICFWVNGVARFVRSVGNRVLNGFASCRFPTFGWTSRIRGLKFLLKHDWKMISSRWIEQSVVSRKRVQRS